jgi:hypothetical protein
MTVVAVRRAIVFALAVGLAVTLAPASASAQASSVTTVAGGYSHLRDLGANEAPAQDYRGWMASVTRQLGTSRIGIAGEVTTNSDKNIVDETQRLTAVLGGVRFRLLGTARLEVFARALAGIERFSEPGFDATGFAFQPGGGVDVRLAGPMGLRAQTDYRVVREGGSTFNELLIGIGAVARFGGD